MERRGRDGDAGALDTGKQAEEKCGGGDHGAGIPRGDGRGALFFLQKIDANPDGRVFFLAEGRDRRFSHADDLARFLEHDLAADHLMLVELPLESRGLSYKHDLQVIEVVGGHDGPLDDDLRGVISAHSVQSDADHRNYSFALALTLITLTSFPL